MKNKEVEKKLSKKLVKAGLIRLWNNWLVSLDDDHLFLVSGSDSSKKELSNIWDQIENKFLLEKFLPIVPQDKPVIIFEAEDKKTYHVFFCNTKTLLHLQKQFDKCLLLDDAIVFSRDNRNTGYCYQYDIIHNELVRVYCKWAFPAL